MTDELRAGASPYRYHLVDGQKTELVDGGVIDEGLVSIYVNGQELATIMCSPVDEEALALGFLYNEGVIESTDEIGLIKMNVTRTVVDVLLQTSEFKPPRRMILTSGCGGGVTFQYLTESFPVLDTRFTTTPDVLRERMRDMQANALLYRQVRGVHIAALASTTALLTSAEDVGRHNAVDKVAGKALQAGITTRDRILLTSGRISSEMLGKARRMGICIVGSRTAPTSLTIRLAEAWNICVVGYIRRSSMRVYTHPHRLGLKDIVEHEQQPNV